MRTSFFRTPKAKQFTFAARYYDAEKEEFEHRIKKIKAEVSGEGSLHVGGAYRPDFKSEWKKNKHTVDYAKRSNLRLFLIVSLLCIGAYYFLFV